MKLRTPQYGNCEVLNPDGQLMFRCCPKKANWYLNRNLGVKVKDDPLTVRLTFTPKGNGHVGDPYFLQKMANRCVVCGIADNLTRHHIVPYCYRKFFPVDLKEHRSYDVVAMCIPCHNLYEGYATGFKRIFADKYSAPLSGKGFKWDKETASIKGAAKALLEHKEGMPKSRQEELMTRLRDHLHKEPTEEIMQELIKLNAHDLRNYVYHGKIVMEQVQNVEEFVKEWRQHFLDKMQPKFMPSDWNVDRHDFTTAKFVVK